MPVEIKFICNECESEQIFGYSLCERTPEQVGWVISRKENVVYCSKKCEDKANVKRT